MNRFRLGSFDVQHKIAAGGMGDVWSGEHNSQGVPVAVKVLRPPGTRNERFRVLFRREVRAVAQLDHPGIITIFDIGDVSDASARASQGGVSAQSPYLVMDFMARGSLSDATSPMPWIKLREILLGVLDALAHAHARGLTHLDIKPGNILLAGKPAGFPIRLTDFGIALFRESLPSEDDAVLGTPAYMAPEQFFGEWRDFGPWTDLYALGCVAYELCSGRLPFASGDMVRLGAAHLGEAPPALQRPADYPSGFDDWVMRLLEKDPEKRFRRCASAAAALLALSADNAAQRVAGTSALGSDGGVGARELEPAWRSKAPPARPFNLIGAGLRLFGLRTVPMVGREAERELFWKSFLGMAEHGHSSLIVVEGSPGVGKSRLARWFCERVHELEAAECLIADHHGLEQRSPGISYMLARAWSCLNMSGPELRRRVASRLSQAGLKSDAFHDAITEILAPASLGSDYIPGTFHLFPARAARYRALLDILRQVHHGRPVVIWLDDAHWDPDALRFVRFALSAALPLMAVVTVREDLVAESPVVSELLRELRRHEHTEYLQLQPLSSQESRRLAHNLLYLAGDLAEGVAARSGGNPLYATQLVGDWVNRGTLRAGTSGFVLSETEAPAIPDDLHAVWTQRVEQVLDECAEEAAGLPAGPIPRSHLQIPLELAAALGGDIDMAEWLSVCTRVGIPDPSPVLERLLASRMASAGPDTWSFGHSMLRDTIETTARERGRWVAHNRVCADMLEEVRPVPHWGDSERIGRHHFAAERFANAWRPLLTGAKERMRMEEYSVALALVSLHDRALDALQAPADDSRRLNGWLLQADIRCVREELAEAGNLATRVAAVPDSAQTMRLHGVASLILARVQQRQGRSNAALRSFKDAERTLRRAGAGAQLGTCLSEQASAMLELGLVADAWESLHEAQQIFEDAGQFIPWMESQLGMARVVSHLGEYGHAVVLCRRVRAFARRDGLSRIEATACDALAEVQREHGEVAEAEVSLNRGIELFEQLGFIRQAQSARISRILLLLQSGAWAHAELQADELTGVPEIELSPVSRLLMSYIRLALVADGPRATFDQHAQQAAALLTEVERPIPSMVQCLGVAIERAGHEPERQTQIAALRDLIADRLHARTTSQQGHGSG
ncbi:MAG: protein kinase [Gemmatimonadaceae bacterium]